MWFYLSLAGAALVFMSAFGWVALLRYREERETQEAIMRAMRRVACQDWEL